MPDGQYSRRFRKTGYIRSSYANLQPCTDRTGTQERDLAAEATQAFQKALTNTKDFEVTGSGRYRLICEVADFRAGSAFARWVLPGLGQTVEKSPPW